MRVWRHRRLTWAFVLKDLRHRYTGSTIGFFWTVITPLLELCTYTFVFHVLIGVKFHPAGGWSNYALFLFAGMVTWMAFAEGLTGATTSISAHAHLIKKLNFPAVVLPAHLIVSAVLNQGIRLSVLCGAAIFLGHGLSWHLALVPLVVLAVPVPLVPLVVSSRVGQNQNHLYPSMLVVQNRVGHSSVRFGLRQ